MYLYLICFYWCYQYMHDYIILAIRERNSFLMVYSVTNKISFQECAPLYEKITRIKKKDYFSLILVGNKSDVSNDVRQVTFDEGKQLAQEFECPFYETSAKTGDGVREVFEEIVREIKKKRPSKPIKRNNNVCSCNDCIIL